jgi:prepilin-type N-terminal cleavage/methylation domain-containing protein
VSERGFTLIELLIVSAIVIVLALAAVGYAGSTRPFAMRSATAEFDAVYAQAHAVAATSANGATLVFLPQVGAPGVTMTLYTGRPDGRPMSRFDPPHVLAAEVRETSLGKPPFSIFVSSVGYVTGTADHPENPSEPSSWLVAAEPACPGGASRSMMLTFSVGLVTSERRLSCVP